MLSSNNSSSLYFRSGRGGGVAHNEIELHEIVERGLRKQVLSAKF